MGSGSNADVCDRKGLFPCLCIVDYKAISFLYNKIYRLSTKSWQFYTVASFWAN